MDPCRVTRSALAVALASTLASCTTLTDPLAARRAPSQSRADQVGVYQAFPPGTRDYKFVTRLWVEPWTSAVYVPRYATVEDGAADLRNRAVALGGDAIVNFGCYHSAIDPRSDYYCNGTVIRFTP